MSSTPSSLKCLMLNAQGLSLSSLFTLYALLSSSSYDCICILEHWFVRDARLSYLSSPFFFAESPLPPPRPQGGHHPGGILLLTSPSLRSLSIAPPLCSPYSITAFFPSLSLHCVYLPPSLSPDEAALAFDPLRAPCVVVGDVNVRYGAPFRDSVCTAPDRRRRLALISSLHSLSHP